MMAQFVKVTARCDYCGGLFTDWRRASADRVFCSAECMQARRRSRPVSRVCPVCETGFVTTEAAIAAKAKKGIECGKYCSRPCQVIGSRQHPRRVRAQNCTPPSREELQRIIDGRVVKKIAAADFGITVKQLNCTLRRYGFDPYYRNPVKPVRAAKIPVAIPEVIPEEKPPARTAHMALPAGHPTTWEILTKGTLLEGAEYDGPKAQFLCKAAA